MTNEEKENRRSDELKRLFQTMKLMKQAGLDTTEIETKIGLNNKNINF